MNNAVNQEHEELLQIMVCDVSHVYCFAPVLRPVYVEFADEDWEEGDQEKCGRFNVSKYGTRDAALNWHQHCIEHFTRL